MEGWVERTTPPQKPQTYGEEERDRKNEIASSHNSTGNLRRRSSQSSEDGGGEGSRRPSDTALPALAALLGLRPCIAVVHETCRGGRGEASHRGAEREFDDNRRRSRTRKKQVVAQKKKSQKQAQMTMTYGNFNFSYLRSNVKKAKNFARTQ